MNYLTGHPLNLYMYGEFIAVLVTIFCFWRGYINIAIAVAMSAVIIFFLGNVSLFGNSVSGPLMISFTIALLATSALTSLKPETAIGVGLVAMVGIPVIAVFVLEGEYRSAVFLATHFANLAIVTLVLHSTVEPIKPFSQKNVG